MAFVDDIGALLDEMGEQYALDGTRTLAEKKWKRVLSIEKDFWPQI